LGVLRDFRRAADALERLAASATVIRENAPALDRLEALELSRAQFEADIEGVLLKAEGKLKAAANAEARERHQRNRREQTDPFDEEGAEGTAPVRAGDVEGSEEDGLLGVRMDVEEPLSGKAYALRAKFM